MASAMTPGATNGPKLSLAGHQGHLTREQEQALEEFRGLVTEAGLYTPANPTTTTSASHTDATLLRHLRARRWDLQNALNMFRDREEWGKKLDLENLYAGYDVEEFTDAQSYYPRWIGRRDKMGGPICVMRFAALTSEKMAKINALTPKQREERIAVLHQHLLSALVPLVSPLPSGSYPTPIDGNTNIVDLDGVSFFRLWSIRSHLQESSTLANRLCAETMGTTWVVNAPSFFSTIWGWLQGWFDENTQSKIHVLSKAQQSELLSEFEPENLPKMYGGKLDWNYEDPPDLDEDIKEALKAIGGICPGGPWAFIDGTPVIGKDISLVKSGKIPAADALRERLAMGNIPRHLPYGP